MTSGSRGRFLFAGSATIEGEGEVSGVNEKVFPFPDRVAAVQAVYRARMELVEAIVRREEKLGPETRDAKARYAIVFGDAILREEKLLVEEARMRRKLERVRSLQIAGERVDMEAVERALDEAFAGERVRVSAEQALRESLAKQYKMERLFYAQRTEHVRLYRDITNKMCPDVIPEIDQEKARLYEDGRKAYLDGQVQKLQMIHFMSRQIPRRVFSGTISELTEERMRLQERTREVKAETQLAMLEAPLTYLEIVDKGDRIEQERRYFQHKAMQLQQSIAKMRRMIAELLRTEP
ncbi:MAG: hypothetical protein ACOX00_02540 [Peptoniphilaceae bacterium]|jgi:hypothetical protein|nr:hypothetical protein [Bacillota bacterium]